MKEFTQQIVENSDFKKIELPPSMFKFEKMRIFYWHGHLNYLVDAFNIYKTDEKYSSSQRRKDYIKYVEEKFKEPNFEFGDKHKLK